MASEATACPTQVVLVHLFFLQHLRGNGPEPVLDNVGPPIDLPLDYTPGDTN